VGDAGERREDAGAGTLLEILRKKRAIGGVSANELEMRGCG
jgi:hypothetical protein